MDDQRSSSADFPAKFDQFMEGAMGSTELFVLLMFLGAVFIFGFALLIGMNIGKKQAENHCPFCKRTIEKGTTLCPWCGNEIPAKSAVENAGWK
jgi:hypothetical protein